MTAKQRQPGRKVRAVAAALTAIAVTASSVTAWVVLGGVEAAQAGTLSKLHEAGQAGSWRSIEAADLSVTAKAGTSFQIDGFDQAAAEAVSARPVSWVVQLTATASDGRAQLRFVDQSEDGPGAVLFHVPDRDTVSVSTLIAVAEDGTVPRIVSDSPVELEARAFAYLVPPDEASGDPAPGGSVAVRKTDLADTNAGLGFTLGQAKEGVSLSPLGLGSVPREGVSGVWVQVTALGESPAVSLGTDAAGLEDVTFNGAAGVAQGLTAVALDGDGAFAVRASKSTSAVSMQVVGWIAAAQFDTDRAVIEGGLMAADPVNAVTESSSLRAPDRAPLGAQSLYAVQLRADTAGEVVGDTSAGTSQIGASATSVEVAGTTSAVMVASSEEEVFTSTPEALRASWIGYFVGDTGAEGESPTVTIDTPAAQERISLVEQHGEVVFAGTAQADAGVVAVHLKQHHRYLGSAELRQTAEGVRWEYRTPAPDGSHTIQVVAIDAAGREAAAKVSFSVDPVAEAETIVAPGVVQLGADNLEQLPEVAAGSVMFDDPIDLKPGDILTIPVTEATPQALMRRVVSVQMVEGKQVVRTASAALSELLLNADILYEDVPVDTDSTPESSAIPEETFSTSDEEQIAAAGSDPDSESDPGEADEEEQAEANGDGAVTTVLNSASGSAIAAPQAASGGAAAQVLSADDDPIAEAEATKRYSANRTSIAVDISGSSTVSDGEGKEAKASGKVKMTLKSGPPRAEAPFKLELNPPLKELKPLELTEPGEGKVDKSDNLALEGKVGATISVKHEVELVTRDYAHFELKIVRAKSWWKLGAPELEVFELSNRQIEERTVKTVGEGKFSAKVGLARAETKQRDTGGLDLDELARSNKADLRLGQLAVPVPGTPVIIWLSFYLTINASLESSLAGSIELNQTYTRMFTVGARYESGWGTARPIAEVTELRRPTFSVTAAVELKTTFKPSITFEVRAYEALGMYVGLEYEISLTTSITGGTAQKTILRQVLKDKFSAFVGVRLQVFSTELFNWSKSFELLKDRDPYFDEKIELGEDGEVPEDVGDEEESSRGDGDQPLALVIDVSGSMSGEPIELAKESLAEVIRSKPAGSEIGIWTYPDSESCSEGSFKVPVRAHSGTGQLLDTIQGLDTGGNTPTGEALEEAAYQLMAEGRTSATLLLVSDGESNCAVPPCEVVQDIRDMGFDLSVPTIAYEISDVGRDELKCIAGATDSNAYEVESMDELGPLIEDLSNASIEANIVTPSTLPSGGVQQVEVVISNPSVREATGVQLLLTANGGPAERVDPVSNIVIGNIPQGKSVSRTLDVYVGEGTGEVDLKLQAWGDNVGAVVNEASFDVLHANDAKLTPAPGPVLSGGDGPARLAIVGDTMLTGVADSASLGAADTVPDCYAGEVVVGESIQQWDAVSATACSDLGEGYSDAQVLEGATHVLLSAGGEDVGLSEMLAQCFEAECNVASASFQNALRAAQELSIDSRLTRIAATQGEESEPPAILVTAYPYLFPDDRGLQCSADISQSEALAMNLLVSHLNTSLEASVQRARELGAEAYFVSGAAESLRPEATLCSDAPGAVLVETDSSVKLVLTEGGVASADRALAAWSEGRDRAPVAELSTEVASATSGLSPAIVGVTVDAPTASFGVDLPAEQGGLARFATSLVQAGQTVQVSGSGYRPGSQVYLTLQTESTVLIGRGAADENGQVRVRAVVPSNTANGTATLAVLGENERGQSFRSLVDVGVGAALPWWVAGLMLLGAALFAAAIVLAFVGWRKRARGVIDPAA